MIDLMGQPFLFHRPRLASGYTDALMGLTPFDRSSGLFLAAPRRTGKTTFMQGDLLAELRSRDVVTAYADLWADRQRDPAALIADALRDTLRGLDGPGAAALRRSGLTKLGIGNWLSFDIARIGTPEGATLTDALRAIAERAGQPVALIIDEAQHALTTQAGVDAMFALKAARDALNGTSVQGGTQGRTQRGPRLLLVLTGSHRDKLANLVLRRDQPFFGAEVSDFPRLGRGFSDAYTAWLNERLAPDNRFDAGDVWTAFSAVGERPELLRKVLEAAALGEGKAASLGAALEGGALALRQRVWDEFEGEWASLSPLQRAVLARVAASGADFVPFSAGALAAYAAAAGREVSASDAQNALDALRQRNLVWRSARATYAIEDQELGAWLAARRATDQQDPGNPSEVTQPPAEPLPRR